MAIYRLLQRSAFTPEDIRPVIAAFEDCERILNLAQRPDVFRERVAKIILEIAQTGVRDPVEMRRQALKRIALPDH